jgi:hypothetical protein
LDEPFPARKNGVMNAKFDPKDIPIETWRALLASASAFAAEKPWEYMDDTRWAGLRDSKGGEARIASVLGGAGKVFAAVFYRRSRGVRWILETRSESFDPESPTTAEGLDALKVAFVEESELRPDRQLIVAGRDGDGGRAALPRTGQSAGDGAGEIG